MSTVTIKLGATSATGLTKWSFSLLNTPASLHAYEIGLNKISAATTVSYQGQQDFNWFIDSTSTLPLARADALDFSLSNPLTMTLGETALGTFTLGQSDDHQRIQLDYINLIQLDILSGLRSNVTAFSDAGLAIDFNLSAMQEGTSIQVVNPLGSNHFLGGQGVQIVQYQSKSTDYRLTYTPYGWQLSNLSGSEIDTLAGIDKAFFSDKLVHLDTMPHGSYSDLPDSLWHFFIVAFNAAPGVEYMNQLAEAYRYSMTVKDIVDVFTTKPQFTSIYKPDLSHTQMGTLMAENIIKKSATDAAKQEAANDIQAALDLGWSIGDVVYTVFGNIAHKPYDDPTWGRTAVQFEKQTLIAKYYTNEMNQATTDLETLRGILLTVDENSATDSGSVVSLVGTALMSSLVE